jgi:acyl-CoA synthetase (AMP-forming)/AMP-acid ligase II
MRGLMMDDPLLVSAILEHAAVYHGDTEIVAREIDGSFFRYDYRRAHQRAERLAQAILRLGVAPGDRVGSLAWNTHRHFEMFYGVSGCGAVLHTVNPRLFREQIVYIVNHCEDRWMFCDLETLPLVERLAPDLTSIEGYCIMCAEEDMPETTLPDSHCYEALLAAEDGEYDWPSFDERSASTICYTSGTTGNPKGVVYSHRSAALTTMVGQSADFIPGHRHGALEVALAISPMFHGNASKDVIKSGGEWISSQEIENLAVGHPDIMQAAVIGVEHPKWQERPLLICVRREGSDIDKEGLLHWLHDKVARWWLPDDVQFIDEIPLTGTGKIHKLRLRERFKDYRLPTPERAISCSQLQLRRARLQREEPADLLYE